MGCFKNNLQIISLYLLIYTIEKDKIWEKQYNSIYPSLSLGVDILGLSMFDNLN